MAAKEWVPPSAAAAAPAANCHNSYDSQQQYNWQYGEWGVDGGYDANGYEYGYEGWQANNAAAAQWGQQGVHSMPCKA